MGRTVGKILTIGGVAVAIGLTAGGAGLLGGAFVAGTAATATAAATAATLFGISTGTLLAIGAGATILGGLLAPPRIPPENLTNAQGQLLTLTARRDAPRAILYGRAASGGDLIYQEALGTDNVDLYTVIAVAGHECESIDRFDWNGEEITFSSNNAVGTFNDKMFLFEHLGAEDQAVDSTLDAASTKWTSDHRLRGICYIVLKLVFDPDKFPQGFQQIRVFTKGRKIYDPRKDTNNGGSGTHRLDDRSTWEFSDNVALCIADYLRGIRMANTTSTSYDGQVIAGMNIADGRGEVTQTAIAAASDIDWANIAAQADICDEPVNLKAGGSENRYTCNGYVNPSNDHGTTLKSMATAMGGSVLNQGGKWRVFAAAPIAAVKSRGQDDIIGTLKYRSKKSISHRINSVRGTIADVANDYEVTPLPALVNSTFRTEDGGQEIWFETGIPFTTSNATGQRLMKIILERSRMEKLINCAMFPSVLTDTVMDTIDFTYEPFNLTAEKMLVTSWTLRFMQQGNAISSFVEYEALEENNSIYDWDETIDEQVPAGRELQTRVNVVPQNLGDLSGDLDDVSDSATRFAAIQANADDTSANTADDIFNINGTNVGDVINSDGRLSNSKVMQPNRNAGPGAQASSTPLDAIDAGATATITISGHDLFPGSSTATVYGGASITGLAFNTTFRVYTDDANWAGGSVTYVAVTSKVDIAKSSARYWVGTVTTPADGGGANPGEGGGGGPLL